MQCGPGEDYLDPSKKDAASDLLTFGKDRAMPVCARLYHYPEPALMKYVLKRRPDLRPRLVFTLIELKQIVEEHIFEHKEEWGWRHGVKVAGTELATVLGVEGLHLLQVM